MRRRPDARAVLSTVALLIAATASGHVASADDRAHARAHPDGASSEQARGPLPGTGSAYSNALRIARMLHDERLVARLLVMHGSGKGATEADLVAVIDAHELAGTPELAVDFLRARVQRYPDERRPRVLLAELLARSGRSREAVTIWQRFVERFGLEALSVDETVRYARDLSRVGDVDAAYAALLATRARAPRDREAYWIDLATLAWERDDAEAALVAYEHVYRLEPKTLHAGLRLMTLLANAKRRDEAVRVAVAEHARTREPAPALFAAHLLESDGDWAGLWALFEELARSPSALAEHAEYLGLRGDAAKHLGDLDEASRAYAAALALAPTDPSVRASALWTAIERGDARQVRTYVDRFRQGTRDEPALWLPLAHGLASIGRASEALVWFSLQLQTTPRDARLLLDLSDALSILGRDTLADDLRRRAVAHLPMEIRLAARSTRKTEEDRHLVESTALALRSHAGVTRAEPWMSELFGSSRGRSSRGSTLTRARRPRSDDELAADWYLATGRPEHARRIIARSSPDALRRQRLALALVDGDPTEMRVLLADETGLSPEDRAHAYVALERDPQAMRVLRQELSRAPSGADAPAMSEELARLTLLHRPNVRVGAAYEHIAGVDVAGPSLAASHDGLGGRLTYAASAARMTDGGGQLLLRGPRDEAEGSLLLRLSTLRGVTDITAAVDYQVGAPIARAGVYDQRRLTRQLGLTTEVRGGSRIYDTGFLRVAAVRNAASVGLRYDIARWYASAEVEGREEHTRSYEHLAWEALASAEGGFKLLSREPHLSVGAQVQASQREYPTRLPGDVARLVSPNVGLVRELPPSFQLVGGVVHLARGDPTERSRPERAPFPRYDCEAALGALLPDTDVALHVLCGASVRAPGGYTTLLVFYNRGVAGVRNNENAELALSYTLPF
ncbi:MAG: tetratricopeptide repeat protein [Labilithrix sp.]|nr:tetratricopeptide repeat protein [Labilithrix sp.]